MRVVLGQGGGWLGMFSVPIIRHLHSIHGKPEAYIGTSVNALNFAIAAQEDWGVLAKEWKETADAFSLDGIHGFLSLAFNNGGIFSTRPVEKKLDKFVSLARLKTKVGVGITYKTPFISEVLWAHQTTSDEQWRSWVLASMSIAFVMNTPIIRLPDGSLRDGRDGGHIYSLPRCPSTYREVDALVHHPLNMALGTPPERKNKLVESLEWLLWSGMRDAHSEALNYLQSLADLGYTVRVWAPKRPMGSMLDASKDALEMREELGVAAIKAGPVLL